MNRIIRILKILRRRGNKFLYDHPIDCVRNEEDIIFINTFGRSGSTLLSELLMSGHRLRYYFEPFHKNTQEVFDWGFYIGRDKKSKEHLRFIEALFEGKVYNEWTKRKMQSFYFNKRVIKAIRASLYAPWIKQNFPGIKLIVLMRNPFAVITSVCRRPENWIDQRRHFETLFFRQEQLLDRFPQEIREKFKNAKTDKEKWMFQWCIEYSILLSNLTEQEFKLVVFERVLKNPEKEMAEIFMFAGLKPHKRWESQIKTPSSSSKLLKNPGRINKDWKKNWTEEEIEMGRQILGLFGMKHIYENTYPNKMELLNCSLFTATLTN